MIREMRVAQWHVIRRISGVVKIVDQRLFVGAEGSMPFLVPLWNCATMSFSEFGSIFFCHSCFSTRFFSQFICIGIRELVSQQASTCMFIRSVFSRISPLTVSSEHSCWFFHLFFITIFVFFSGCGYSSYFYKGQRPIVWDHKCLTDWLGVRQSLRWRGHFEDPHIFSRYTISSNSPLFCGILPCSSGKHNAADVDSSKKSYWMYSMCSTLCQGVSAVLLFSFVRMSWPCRFHMWYFCAELLFFRHFSTWYMRRSAACLFLNFRWRVRSHRRWNCAW